MVKEHINRGQGLSLPLAGPWPCRIDSVGGRATSAGRLRHERRKIARDLKLELSAAMVDADGGLTITSEPGMSEIYFSPVEATASTAFLSDPFELRSKDSCESCVLTPSSFTSMLARFPAAPQPPASAAPQVNVADSNPSKFILSTNDLNELIVALADTPLVRFSLHNDYPKRLMVPSTESNTPKPKASPLYSQLNTQFITSEAQEVVPRFELTSTAPGAVTLTSAISEDQFLRASSLRTDLLQDKARSQIVMPTKTRHAAMLQTIRGSSACEPVKIILQVVSTTMNHKTLKVMDYLSAEHDVTQSFVKAVLEELAMFADIDRDAITISEQYDRESCLFRTTASIDWANWMAWADELLIVGETNNIIDGLLLKLQSLDAETCSMQVLTLMSEMSHIYASSVDCIIVQPKPKNDSKLWQAQILQVSRSMAAKLEDMDSCVDMSPTRTAASRAFLRKVCGMVVSYSTHEQCYSITNTEDLIHRFDVVPLFKENGAKPFAWAAFVQPTFVHWQMI